MLTRMKIAAHISIFCLVFALTIARPQHSNLDERWVWRTVRSLQTDSSNFFNPFANFDSSNPTFSGIVNRGNVGRSFEGNRQFLFPGTSSVPLRGNTAEKLLLGSEVQLPQGRGASSQTLSPSPQDGVLKRTVFPFEFDEDLLGNSFNETPQLGQPVSIALPTSNHLPTGSEPLISSYSSLDANPDAGESGIGRSAGGLRAKALLGAANQNSQAPENTLEPIKIRPLPIDISTLPLESSERAEGIRKLWSPITTRTEFVRLFDSLTSVNPSSPNRDPQPANHGSSTVNPFFVTSPPSTSTTSSTILSQDLNPEDIRLLQQQQNNIQQQIQTQRQQQQLLRQRQQQERLQQKLRDSTSQSSSSSSTTTTTSPSVLDVGTPVRTKDTTITAPQAIQFFNINQQTDTEEKDRAPIETTEIFLGSGSILQHPSSRTPIKPAAKFVLRSGSADLKTARESNSSTKLLKDAQLAKDGLVQTSVHFPQRSDSFTVRKLRLPGNNIANVVFIPSATSREHQPGDDLLESRGALKFFQKPDVQKAIRELNSEDMVFIVEESKSRNRQTFVITTVEGKKVYPLESDIRKRDNSSFRDAADVTVWDAFMKLFDHAAETQLARKSQELESSGSSPGQGLGTSSGTVTTIPDPAPLTRGTLILSHKSSDLERFPRNQQQVLSGEISKPIKFNKESESPYSPRDEFKPFSFNPFIPRFVDSENRRSSLSSGFKNDLPATSNSLAQDFESSLPKKSKSRKFFNDGFALESRGSENVVNWIWPTDFSPATTDYNIS